MMLRATTKGLGVAMALAVGVFAWHFGGSISSAQEGLIENPALLAPHLVATPELKKAYGLSVVPEQPIPAALQSGSAASSVPASMSLSKAESVEGKSAATLASQGASEQGCFLAIKGIIFDSEEQSGTFAMVDHEGESKILRRGTSIRHGGKQWRVATIARTQIILASGRTTTQCRYAL